MLRVVLLGVLAVVVTAAGCARPVAGQAGQPGQAGQAGQTGQKTTGTATADGVAWMKQFCTAVRDVQRGIWQVPVADGVDSPEELREAARRMFEAAAAALATGEERLGALGNPPVDGGSAAVRGLTDRFAATRRQAEEGRSRLEKEDPGTVLGATWPKVVAVAGRPFEGVAVTGGMRAAGDGPGCAGIAGWPR